MAVTIQMSDNFDDNSIDTAKWDETDGSGRINETSSTLRFTASHGSNYDFGSGGILTSDLAISSGVAVAQANFDWTDEGGNEALGLFGLWVDSGNFAGFISRSGGGNVGLLIRDGSSDVYVNQATSIANAKDFKVSYNLSSKDINFYYWNGSAWVQMGTTQNFDFGSSVKFAISTSDNTTYTNGDLMIFDNAYLVVGDYSVNPPVNVIDGGGSPLFFSTGFTLG